MLHKRTEQAALRATCSVRGRGRRGSALPDRASETQTTRATAFSKIKAGLEDAVAYRGARQLTVRDVELKPPPAMGAREVLAVRARLRVSQAAFARILNVGPQDLQA